MNARALWISAGLLANASFAPAQEPIAPKEPIKLFNGKNLDGWTTWLKDTKRDDPRLVFTAKDGILHVSGDGFGYIATAKEYRDYHLSVEYKWGKKTDGGKLVRNSGVLLHAIGPDGGAGGTWMSCIECQLAQGCVGDLIPIRGKNERGITIPVVLAAETALGSDKRLRWKADGEIKVFYDRQLWWNKHEAGFKELLDTRGKDDLESPLGEWTKVECLCRDKTIEIRVNGKTVNKTLNVFPAAGKILLQTEGFEIDFRNVELRPLEAPKEENDGSYAKVEMRGKLFHDVGRSDPGPSWDRWMVVTKKLACRLEFGANKEFLDCAKKKNNGKNVIVRGQLEYGPSMRWPSGPPYENHINVVSIELAKEDP